MKTRDELIKVLHEAKQGLTDNQSRFIDELINGGKVTLGLSDDAETVDTILSDIVDSKDYPISLRVEVPSRFDSPHYYNHYRITTK